MLLEAASDPSFPGPYPVEQVSTGPTRNNYHRAVLGGDGDITNKSVPGLKVITDEILSWGILLNLFKPLSLCLSTIVVFL